MVNGSVLEEYIADRLGKKYLDKVKKEFELKMVKKEISELKKKLTTLQDKKTQLEEFLSKCSSNKQHQK
ncbi:MAG: hypothetical protein ISS19_17785 [Bacteroidales bacterium]|nr:hypothetical protein [Bacteroidales bacterium]